MVSSFIKVSQNNQTYTITIARRFYLYILIPTTLTYFLLPSCSLVILCTTDVVLSYCTEPVSHIWATTCRLYMLEEAFLMCRILAANESGKCSFNLLQKFRKPGRRGLELAMNQALCTMLSHKRLINDEEVWTDRRIKYKNHSYHLNFYKLGYNNSYLAFN